MIWFLVGLFTGLAVGVLLRDAWFIAEPALHDLDLLEDDVPINAPGGIDRRSNDRRRPVPAGRKMVLLVIVLAMALLVLGVAQQLNRNQDADQDRQIAAQTQRNEEYAACLFDWAQDFAEYNEARTKPSTRVSVAIHTFLQATYVVLRPTPTPAEVDNFTKSLRDYLDLYDKLEQARDQNPIPALPEETCGAGP